MKPAFNVRQQSEIFIGPVADILPGALPEGRVVVVSDSTIDRLYHSVLAQYDTVLIGLGESVKTMQTVEMIYRRFIELGVDRSTFVLAVGGGIVTDVAGFAASTYMRGVKFGFVSTTLLGQVDASVGGKNGVNVDGYKNMAGTFTSRSSSSATPRCCARFPSGSSGPGWPRWSRRRSSPMPTCSDASSGRHSGRCERTPTCCRMPFRRRSASRPTSSSATSASRATAAN